MRVGVAYYGRIAYKWGLSSSSLLEAGTGGGDPVCGFLLVLEHSHVPDIPDFFQILVAS